MQVMEKILDLAKTNRAYIIGAFLGGIGGYLYWRYVGCSTGTCPITSSPVMSTLWGALFGALLFSLILPKKTQSKTELKNLLNNGALLLDVRTRGEFAGGHAKNSKNIPLDELGKEMQQLDKNQHIIVVCASGMRSSQAVSIMKQNGFTNCVNGGSWVNFKEY
jgi:rhodanese-related sulfurtransferase